MRSHPDSAQLFLQLEKQLELQLFRLYHTEREIDEFGEDLEKLQHNLSKEHKKKSKIEDEMKEVKKEQAKMTRELGKIEQSVKESVSYFMD